jgi:8-oxo-dGTP pyrophosphatase MutT (NUDIX family)
MNDSADAEPGDEPDPAPGQPAPIERVSARVLLVDDDGRVLLFRGGDPAQPEAGHWWFTPGGGAEAGESLVETARREVQEETGHVLPDDLGPVIHIRTAQFSFEGVLYRQTDHFFRAAATHSQVDYSGWTETDRLAIHLHHWWTMEELAATSEPIYPEGLLELLART